MAKLPVLTGDKVVKAFSRAGWMVARQKGSHVKWSKKVHP